MTHTPTIQSLQQSIVEEATEEWLTLTEEDAEEAEETFAGALRSWYDTQMDELHDSRGDAEYQQQIIQGLRSFRVMIQQIKEEDFDLDRMEEWIRIETLPQDQYLAALKKNSALPE